MTSIVYKQQLKQLPNNFQLLFKGYVNYVSSEEDPIELKWGLFKKYCRIEEDPDSTIKFNNIVSIFNQYSDKYINEFIYVVFKLKYFKNVLSLKDSLDDFNKLFNITEENSCNTDIIHQSSFFNDVLLNEWRIWYLYGKHIGIEWCDNDISKTWTNFNKFWDVKYYKYLNTSISLKMYFYLNHMKELEFEIIFDSPLIKAHYQTFILNYSKYYLEKLSLIHI
jgi:hypothetical protein